MESRFGSHVVGRYFLTTLIGITIVIMIPLTLGIIFAYCKHREVLQTMFKTGLCYFIFTLLFYINFCLRLLNEIIGDVNYGIIFVCTTALFWSLHFSFLILMLFGRIYLVFDNTQYQVSNTTIYSFIGLSLFVLINMSAFIFVVLYTNDEAHGVIFALYSIGIVTIV